VPGRKSKNQDATRSTTWKWKRNACGVENCDESTANGKPYCRDHLDLAEKTECLIATVNARQNEIDKVLAAGSNGWRHVETSGSVAQDILAIIQVYGPQTISALSRNATLKAAIVIPYVRALAAKGLVRISPQRTASGATQETISLIPRA